MNMREEFEKWYQVQDGAPEVKEFRDIFKLDENGEYYFLGTRLGWQAWQTAWQAAQPKWIECSDRRPDIEGKFITDGTYGVGTSFFDPSWSNVFQDCASNNDEGMEDFEGRIFRVTRWMPLPNPPEE
ncbi:DUF551 domain-containing protein [Edwardsiella piscicida]